MATSPLVLLARNLIQPLVLLQARNSLSCSTIKSIRIHSHLSRAFGTSSVAHGRLYSEKHEWLDVGNDNIGVVGISHHAQESLGDVVYAQLPDIGTKINKDQEVGALESVKAAVEVYSPVSGEIVDINKEVEETPGIINQSCYEKGWLFKIALSNVNELNQLMNEDQYTKYLKAEEAAQ